MEERNSCPYQGYSIVNPDVFQELRAAMIRTNRRKAASDILVCLAVLFLCPYMHMRSVRQGFTFLTFILALTHLLNFYREKKGIFYQKFLEANNGTAPIYTAYFGNQGIRLQKEEASQEAFFPYASVKRLIESDTLLILLLPDKRCFPIRKYSIKGCTPEELSAFILERMDKRQKKPARGTFGNAVSILRICVIAIALAAAVHYEYAKPVFSPKEVGSYQQAAQELETLGISGFTPEMQQSLDEETALYFEYGFEPDYRLGILCRLGAGTYDPETWEWTPGTNGVYWFDMEFLSVDCMYTDFLRGIMALCPEELDFTEIHTDLSEVNPEEGSGIQTLTFHWNGKEHTLKAMVEYDWFDYRAADRLARIIQRENTGKELYFAYDYGQGLLVFYADEVWAKEFQETTGIPLQRFVRELNVF